MMGGPKKGDWIKCSSREDVKQVLRDLNREGCGAVADFANYIHITQEPREDRHGKKEKLPQDG